MPSLTWHRQQAALGLTFKPRIGNLYAVTANETPVRYPHFATQVREGMRRAGLKVQDVATECGVTRETVRLWRKGETVARDDKLRKLSKMIGVDPSALRFEPGKSPPLPQVNGEHITDEDELALLRAYRGLKKPWAREALRRRAVELLEEFGEKDAANPWGKAPGTQ